MDTTDTKQPDEKPEKEKPELTPEEQEEEEFKRKIAELRKRDPFVYR